MRYILILISFNFLLCIEGMWRQSNEDEGLILLIKLDDKFNSTGTYVLYEKNIRDDSFRLDTESEGKWFFLDDKFCLIEYGDKDGRCHDFKLTKNHLSFSEHGREYLFQRMNDIPKSGKAF